MNFRTAILPVLLLLGAANAFAQALAPDFSGNDPHWIQDPDSKCWAANPDPAEHESISWTGACENMLLTGQGTLTWYKSGKITGHDIGNFKEGQLSGRGSILFADGARFDGEFPGRGVLTAPDGRTFLAQSVQENSGWAVRQVDPNELK